MELRVNSAARQQFFMAALIDHAPFVHHDDPVGIADGGQAVGNHQGGPTGAETVERRLYDRFGAGIEG